MTCKDIENDNIFMKWIQPKRKKVVYSAIDNEKMTD